MTYSISTRLAVLGALAAGLLAAAPVAAQELNLYTYREPGLIKPLIDAFTAETGIKVNTIFASSGLEERIRTEGQNSPADVLLTVDIGRLQQAKDYGITQAVKSEKVESAIPATYRDPEGHWFGISLRGRVIYAAKDRVKQDGFTYEELADPKWRGRICIRSGQHLYNISLFAATVAHMGEGKAEEWLRGLKANLAKKPSGGDRDVAKDIAAGVCDIGLGNTYYVALMLNGKNEEQRKWAEAVKVVLPTFAGGGTHVNISGASVAKHHADLNLEYPIKKGVAVDETVASFGRLQPDTLPISDIAKHRKAASELVDKVGFDR
jgi:iron(III) transport system substrate-binding protein